MIEQIIQESEYLKNLDGEITELSDVLPIDFDLQLLYRVYNGEFYFDIDEYKKILYMLTFLSSDRTEEFVFYLRFWNIRQIIINSTIELIYNKFELKNKSLFAETCSKGFIRLVLFLLKENPIKDTLNSGLIEAIENNHVDIVELLIEKGADIHLYDKRHFYLVCKMGYFSILKIMIKSDNNNNFNYNHIDEGMVNALKNNHQEIVKFFIDKGFEINTASDELLSALYNLNDLEFIKSLIKNDANLHWYSKKHLFYACMSGKIEIVNYLFDCGVSLNRNNDELLMRVCACGYLDIVKLLIAKGANVYSCQNIGLIVASEYGHVDVVSYLLTFYSNDSVNLDEPLLNASEKGHVEIVKLLIAKGAKPLTYFNNALLLAIENNHLDVIKILLEMDYEYSKELISHCLCFKNRRANNKEVDKMLADKYNSLNL